MKKKITRLTIIFGIVLLFCVSSIGVLGFQLMNVAHKVQTAQLQNKDLQNKLSFSNKQFIDLKNTDQVKRNDELQDEVKHIQTSYGSAVTTYEDLLKLKELTTKTQPLDEEYTKVLTYLSQKNYASADATLAQLQKDIQKQKDSLTSSFSIPQNVAENNTAPGSGYQRQKVHTDLGDYLVDIIAADLNSTKVIVDTASDGDCADNCPVMALGDYASRSGAYAGINGPYFCPASYPSCAGKANSFDTLIMNKNKVYFNSANNVYSTVPAAIFSVGSARFVGHSQEWGRDTGVDSVIAAQPALVLGGNVMFSGDDEAKRSGKGARPFIGATNNIAYIGIVYNASAAEAASVIHTMGIQNALNLDSGGSVAMWSNGRYLAGPGRNTPFGILFVRR